MESQREPGQVGAGAGGRSAVALEQGRGTAVAALVGPR